MYKKVFILAMLVITAFACAKSSENANYYPEFKLDTQAQLKNTTNEAAEKKFSKIYKEFSEDKDETFNSLPDNLFFMLYISENGTVKNVEPVVGLNDKANTSIAKELKALEFNPAMVSNKAVPSKLMFKIGYSEYLTEVDEMPTIVGGMMALAKNVVYPEEAKTKGLEGKVILKVSVNTDGTVDSSSVVKSDNKIFDAAAMRAVKETKFTPGKKDGKPVKAEVMIPIMFKLK